MGNRRGHPGVHIRPPSTVVTQRLGATSSTLSRTVGVPEQPPIANYWQGVGFWVCGHISASFALYFGTTHMAESDTCIVTVSFVVGCCISTFAYSGLLKFLPRNINSGASLGWFTIKFCTRSSVHSQAGLFILHVGGIRTSSSSLSTCMSGLVLESSTS